MEVFHRSNVVINQVQQSNILTLKGNETMFGLQETLRRGFKHKLPQNTAAQKLSN